ncbi:MAG: Gfo/Idh/MocA family oxidoreductase [Phycisphaerae bacterium]
MSFRVAVVGCGKMGKLHARVLSEMPDAELVGVVDSNEATARAVARQRDCRAFTTVSGIVDKVDAAIISVPTVHHLQAAQPLVQAGKSVLIEKPFTNDLEGGQKLIDLAEETGASVQVGHTERFNPVAVAMRKYDIKPKFIEADRISPFTFRSADVGVVLDMMIHDIDLVLMLLGSGAEIEQVHAVGVNVIGEHEDICNARLMFANGSVVNITASRLAIKTERKMRIFSEEAYLSVDYARKVGLVVTKSENLDLIQMAREKDISDLAELAQSVDYTKLLNVEELVIDESAEPLRHQAEAFRDTVVNGAGPVCSAADGLAAVRLAREIVDVAKRHRWDGPTGPREGLDILTRE